MWLFCHLNLDFPIYFIELRGGGEGIRTSTCHVTVDGASKGMLPVRYLCSNKYSFCVN